MSLATLPPREKAVFLTAREHQLVDAIALGLCNKEIATRLGIEEGTVKVYCCRLFAKTGMTRFEIALNKLRTEIVRLQRENAMLTELIEKAPV